MVLYMEITKGHYGSSVISDVTIINKQSTRIGKYIGICSGVATGGQGGGQLPPPWLWKMENSEICHLGENDTQLQCGFGF